MKIILIEKGKLVFLKVVDSGDDNGDQDGNDGDDSQHLDQGEALLVHLLHNENTSLKKFLMYIPSGAG